MLSFGTGKPDSVPPGSRQGSAVISLPPSPLARRRKTADAPCAEAQGGRDATYPRLWDGPPSLLFCLAPEGVFRAARLAECAVGSYPTFSPLPFVPEGPNGGLFSVTLSVDAA